MKRRKNKSAAMTFEEVEARKDRGVEGLRRLGEDERAERLDQEDVEDFAERKKITIVNPRKKKKPHHGGTESRRKPRKRAKNTVTKCVSCGATFDLEERNKTRPELKNRSQDHCAKCLDKADREPLMTRRNPRRRRNSDDVAAATRKFEEFHGRRPETVKEIEVRQNNRRNLTGLGVLMYLQLAEGLPIKFSPHDKVILACDPEGDQLYFVGGNQDLTSILKQAGINQSKDLVDVGECRYIIYTTDKDFDNFEEKDYQHEFGEETGELPRLMFDRLNQQMYLLSGAYQVKREGIVN